MLFVIILSLFIIKDCLSISSPIKPLSNYELSIELEKNVADLWWKIDNNKKEITFELHVNTTGWISLGISPGGGMKGADIGVGWIDGNGTLYFQDRYAFNSSRPIIDNTTKDWIELKGVESNGWTAIQFKRLLDTCDPMDYPIKSGTNIIIYAYGIVDPINSQITYHTPNRRGTRMIPLLSYSQPPSDEKFSKLDHFDLLLNNYAVPSDDTTYHCKVYKVPFNSPTKRHAIAYKVLIDNGNADLVHHLLLHECNPSSNFNDNQLPDGVCDDISKEVENCSSNIATGWAVGGNHIVEFPEEAGYPIGMGSINRYFMIQMHYDNPKLDSNRIDSSGIRFYLSDKPRENDLGYLTFGTASSLLGVAIPPKVDNFIIDSYCPSSATKNIPKSGITVFTAFPHTHLQGISMWTKLIRNKKAVEYLFNAESYHFNYQFENRLTNSIKLYPGDEFATRCIYNTMNKDEITTGGEKTKEEMCLHFFTYYPRMNDFSACFTANTPASLQNLINPSSAFNYSIAKQWLLEKKWTPEASKEWQEYYNKVPRLSVIARGEGVSIEQLGTLPTYEDLKPIKCEITNNSIFISYNLSIILLFLTIFLFSNK